MDVSKEGWRIFNNWTGNGGQYYLYDDTRNILTEYKDSVSAWHKRKNFLEKNPVKRSGERLSDSTIRQYRSVLQTQGDFCTAFRFAIRLLVDHGYLGIRPKARGVISLIDYRQRASQGMTA